MTNSHVCLAGVMGVMEVNSLTTVLQRKAVETLNAVGGNPPLRCHLWPSLEGDAKRHQLAPCTSMASWYCMVFHPLPPEDSLNFTIVLVV